MSNIVIADGTSTTRLPKSKSKSNNLTKTWTKYKTTESQGETAN